MTKDQIVAVMAENSSRYEGFPAEAYATMYRRRTKKALVARGLQLHYCRCPGYEWAAQFMAKPEVKA